jgi:hypothetical protein
MAVLDWDRNPTGSTDLDAGLWIIGRLSGHHRKVKDVTRLAEGLLTEANWPDEELAELRQARWESRRNCAGVGRAATIVL